jgi:acyl dehydratase
MRGKCIEDFNIGRVDTSRVRTITETDVVTFSWLSGGREPHAHGCGAQPAFAARSRIAHGALGLSICTRLSAGLGYLEGSAIAALGTDEWRLLKRGTGRSPCSPPRWQRISWRDRFS